MGIYYQLDNHCLNYFYVLIFNHLPYLSIAARLKLILLSFIMDLRHAYSFFQILLAYETFFELRLLLCHLCFTYFIVALAINYFYFNWNSLIDQVLTDSYHEIKLPYLDTITAESGMGHLSYLFMIECYKIECKFIRWWKISVRIRWLTL